MGGIKKLEKSLRRIPIPTALDSIYSTLGRGVMTRDGWGRLTSERRKRGEYAVAVLGSRGEAIGLFNPSTIVHGEEEDPAFAWP